MQVMDSRGVKVRGLQCNRNVAGEAVAQLMPVNGIQPRGDCSSRLDPRLDEAPQLDPALPTSFRYVVSLSGRQLHSRVRMPAVVCGCTTIICQPH